MSDQIKKRPQGFKAKLAPGIMTAIQQHVPDATAAELVAYKTADDTDLTADRKAALDSAIKESGFSADWVFAAAWYTVKEADAKRQQEQALKLAPQAGVADENGGTKRAAPKAPSQMPDLLKRFFKPLGHSRQTYYFLSYASREVVDISIGSLANKTVLYQLAERGIWLEALNVDPTDPWGELAADLLIGECQDVGPYEPSRIRGRGGFVDTDENGKERVVFHMGDTLVVDGAQMPIEQFETEEIYEAGPRVRVNLSHPITAAEGQRMLDLFRMPRWERAENGTVLAGWAFLAPIAGALEWRPHIYITGKKGSGKTTVVNMLNQLHGATMLTASGKSSEAGIRQTVKSDALPIFVDEFEGDNPADARKLQSTMELARQASSESAAKILRGTVSGRAQDFQARSMFAFSSINVNLICSADESRVTTLTLTPSPANTEDERRASLDQYEKLKTERDGLLTKGFGDRMTARAVKMVPKIRASAAVFRDVVVLLGGDDRTGDQLGTLLAGAWMLSRDEVVSEAEARAFVTELGWNSYAAEAKDDDDDQKLIAAIASAQVRVEYEENGAQTKTIGELLELTVAQQKLTGDAKNSNGSCTEWQVLARHGIRVEAQGVFIAQKNENLRKLLRDTPWGSTYRTILKRVPGAQPWDSTVKFAGAGSRAVVLPFEAFVDFDSEQANAA